MDDHIPEAKDGAASEAECYRVVVAIEAGMADSRAGRTMTHAQLVTRMEARFAGRSK
ncbi:hypothetical protein [Enhygromyxa salina]|uniref:Uncharacterized protein n=1 Tax=Enhygromyxa salina TaxID=215803 RepID=A0A2S9YUI1_9BACT|nr:hypothetical protein [Enhygromyxa salina]PRQ08699.1 hypothetical protein ENSA7_16000 [Enhygromyxa salina]